MKKRLDNLAVNFIIVVIVIVVGCVSHLSLDKKVADMTKPVYNGKASNSISLMFNLDGDGKYLHDVLNTLDEYESKATFFINAKWAEENNDLVKLIVKRGHEIANCGYVNRNYSALAIEEVKGEIKTAERYLENLTGIKTSLFSPPGGVLSENVIKACDEIGYTVVMWSYDCTANMGDEYEIVQNLKESVKAGDIIRLRPNKNSKHVLTNFLDFCRTKGLQIKILSECI